MLGNSDQSRLVVGSGVDGAETVSAFVQTVGNISGEGVSTIIQPLEEGELARVSGGCLGERLKLLNDNVGVSLDISSLVDLLGSRKVGLRGIGEVSGFKMLELQLDGERLVGFDLSHVGGGLELA